MSAEVYGPLIVLIVTLVCQTIIKVYSLRYRVQQHTEAIGVQKEMHKLMRSASRTVQQPTASQEQPLDR